jgi:peptide subunit release factor 1 (eRF1)
MADQPRISEMTRAALLRRLDLLDGLSEPDATTLYLRPHSAVPAISSEATAAIERLASPTGTVLLWGSAAQLVVGPPFPVEHAERHAGYAAAPLRELLTRPRTVGVVLVRLGGYSAGIYRDGAFVDAKTGGRFVKNRHRKGGQSQRRFERIREGQIREHFDDVAEVVRTRLLPAAADLDAVILGGDRHTIQAFLKRAPLPPPLATKLLPRTLDVPEPRREVLERTPTAIWSSRVFIVRDPVDIR